MGRTARSLALLRWSLRAKGDAGFLFFLKIFFFSRYLSEVWLSHSPGKDAWPQCVAVCVCCEWWRCVVCVSGAVAVSVAKTSRTRQLITTDSAREPFQAGA